MSYITLHHVAVLKVAGGLETCLSVDVTII